MNQNHEADLISRLAEYGKENKIPTIDPEAGALLAGLVAQTRPRFLLEIGTAIGYSTLIMAMNLPPEGHIITIDIDEERTKIAKAIVTDAGYGDKVSFLTGDGTVLTQTLSGPFDLVFIDGAKGQYPAYLTAIIPKLSDKALIVADNVLFRGYIENSAAPPRRYKTIVKRLRDYLDTVTHQPGFETKILPIGDGLAVTQFTREKQR